MEATTLESAVDSLLAPEVGGEPTQEDNLRDAVEDMIEPTQDAESQPSLDAEEDADAVEASDDSDYEDDATEYTDEVEAVEDDSDDTLFDVTIDGKPERWTLSQLKQSAAGQGYIQQKMRENAEVSKQLQEYQATMQQREAQLAQQQQAVLNMYQQMQQGGLTAPTPPSKELLESDPIGYMQEKEAYEEAMGEYSAKMRQLQQMQQQRSQMTEQQQAAYRQEQLQLLQQRNPDFADPQKSEKVVQEVLRGGQEYYGVPQETLMNLTNAVEIEVLYDAIRYRKMQANRNNIDAKAKQARPMVKAGSKKVQDGQAVTRRKAQRALREKGTMDAAMALMLDPNL